MPSNKTSARATTRETCARLALALLGGNVSLIAAAVRELSDETKKPMIPLSKVLSRGAIQLKYNGKHVCTVAPQVEIDFEDCIVVVDVPIQFFLKYKFKRCELVFLPGCMIEAHEVSLSWTRVWGKSGVDCRSIRTQAIKIESTKAPIYVHKNTKRVEIGFAEKPLAEKPLGLESLVTKNCSEEVAAEHARMMA